MSAHGLGRVLRKPKNLSIRASSQLHSRPTSPHLPVKLGKPYISSNEIVVINGKIVLYRLSKIGLDFEGEEFRYSNQISGSNKRDAYKVPKGYAYKVQSVSEKS